MDLHSVIIFFDLTIYLDLKNNQKFLLNVKNSIIKIITSKKTKNSYHLKIS